MYHILLAADDNYLKFLPVCITSIILNTDKTKTLNDYHEPMHKEIYGEAYSLLEDDRKIPDYHEEKYIFHVLTDELSDKYRENFKSLEHELSSFFPLEIKFNVLPSTQFHHLRTWKSSYLAYYRLIMDKFLPDNLEKVLYLDGSDTLISVDIRQLFALNIDNVFGAVADRASDKIRGKVKPLNMPKDDFYFNSGVILVNFQEWKKYNISEKSLEYLKKYNPAFVDQDALNAIFEHNVISIPYTWNMMIDKTNPPENPIRSPKIAHFAFKPWKSSNSGFWITDGAKAKYYYHPDIDTWWEMAEKTPVFNKELFAYRESFAYQKITARQRKLEKLLTEGSNFQIFLYKLNKAITPYIAKIEAPAKKIRKKIKDYLYAKKHA